MPRRRERAESCGTSSSGEPIVSAVFPESAGKAVGHEHRRDPFWILETKLGRNTQLERISIAKCEYLIRNLEREKGLRVQRRSHVDARMVSVGAFEADIFGGGVGADALEECTERHAGPFTDHAPAFHANVTRDLGFLRQLIKLLQFPRGSSLDQARQI